MIVAVSEISNRTAQGMERSSLAVADLAAEVEELGVMRSVFERLGGGEVQAVVNALAESPALRSLRRADMERVLKEAIRANRYLELLYVTDAKGVQLVGNIAAPGRESLADTTACGKNWSTREWFSEPLRIRNLYITKAYVSSASGENCITVSRPFHGADGAVLGVLAADVTL